MIEDALMNSLCMVTVVDSRWRDWEGGGVLSQRGFRLEVENGTRGLCSKNDIYSICETKGHHTPSHNDIPNFKSIRY